MNASDIGREVLAGDVNVDLAGTGVPAAAQARIASSAALRASSDDPVNGFTWFAYLSTVVKPMNNVHCRMAVEYAASKTSQQAAYGGPVAGGDIAITVAPPDVIAQSLQAALRRAGIRLSLHGYPSATYFSDTAGVPQYVHQHKLGIVMGGWVPDWPDGYAFLDPITAGGTISPAGNTNIAGLRDPRVNSLLARMAATNDTATRNSYTAQIDSRVMKDAAILPEVYGRSLLYRSPNLTNVYVQPYYSAYNDAVLGVR
jgi:peptide/nickel transport system substrate-binding protein